MFGLEVDTIRAPQAAFRWGNLGHRADPVTN